VSGHLWSILVPTVPSRRAKLGRLLAQLDAQRTALFGPAAVGAEEAFGGHDGELSRCPVRVVTHCTPPTAGDKNTVGEKRNVLIANAESEFISFVDDDDILRDDYVSAIYDALTRAPLDLVTFDVLVFGHGDRAMRAVYGLDMVINRTTQGRHERMPNHLMVWRRSLCVEFEPRSYGEDTLWAEKMIARHIPLRWQRIDRVLYEYHYNRHDSVCASTVR
jgi:hypothetical protein